jgi:ubiquinone/menaquinone biosynthesis C-methylase UbiE
MHKFNIKNIEKLDNPQRRKSMPPEETLEKFKISDNGVFLDVGCGLGYFTIPAAKIMKNGKAIGIDIMPEILEVARERAEGISNIEFKRSEEYDFPIENKSIDYIFISNVIHEIDDKLGYFNEIKRVLKNSGYLCIIDWEKREMDMGPPVTERISRDEMKDFCSSAGFSFVEEIDINLNHYGLKFQLI